jgi:plasmid replication initiation protein
MFPRGNISPETAAAVEVSPGKHSEPRTNRAYIDGQFDLFLPYLSDIGLRDQREMMERPFFSLAKSKRLKPIDYRSPDGKIWVHVSGNPEYGMATIWDADILMYCASVVSDMKRRGINDVPQTLHVMPYDLLRVIGRPTTGRAYELLAQSLDRLQSTTVKTNIRAAARHEATFSWLDSWTQLVEERTERSRGMSLTLARWFWEGLMMEGGVLSINPAYFNISGGRERWLYKVARKHAGGAGEGGFAISLPTLFEKSGAEGVYRRFKFEIAAIVKRNKIPDYDLALEQRAERREPVLRMTRVDAGSAPRKAQSAPPAAKAVVGKISDATLAVVRRDCPGWDYQNLHDQFRAWLTEDGSRTPANYQNAFIGYVRRYHERHKHELRGH